MVGPALKNNNHSGSQFRLAIKIVVLGSLPLFLVFRTSILDATDAATSSSSSLASSSSEATRTTPADDSDLIACHKEVFVNLPIGLSLGGSGNTYEMFAHHGAAANWGQWNQEVRLEPMEVVDAMDPVKSGSGGSYSSCSIWEVGAHKHATDSKELMKRYPYCSYHAFEPVPEFFAVLQKDWAEDSRMALHNYGLANKNQTLTMPKTALEGESTYLGKNKDSKNNDDNTFEMKIRTFDYAVQQAGNQIPTVLHVNCEGCEWDMIPQMLDAGFIQKVPVINLGTHAYPIQNVGKRSIEYCQFRLRLSRTHTLHENSCPFAWERWTKKKEKKTT
jgi:FkbM family methyltransferase